MGSTTSRVSVLALGLALLGSAAACDRAKSSGDGGEATGSATASETGGTAATGSGGKGTTQTGGASGSGGIVDCQQVDEETNFPVWAAACEAATDEASCRNAIPEAWPCAHCVWEDWVPTTLDENGQCVYGPVTATCKFEAFGDGCEESWTNCKPGLSMYRVTDGGQVELHLGEYCLGPTTRDGLCAVDEQGKAFDSVAPECACICDPDFPG